MTIDEIARYFQPAKKNGNGGYIGRCPVCGRDRHLYINPGKKEGQTVLYCQGCNAGAEEILSNVGLTMEALFPPKPAVIPREHVYRDEDGFIYAVKQIKPQKDDPSKKVAYWYHFDENGKQIWKQPEKGYTPLYHADILARNNTSSVLICEGEKDCETLNKIGFKYVTTLPNGANQKKWTRNFDRHFCNKCVVVYMDNDPPGLQYGQMIKENLEGLAENVLLVRATDIFPEAKPKWDVTDILEELEAKNPGKGADLLKEALERGENIAFERAEAEIKKAKESDVAQNSLPSGETSFQTADGENYVVHTVEPAQETAQRNSILEGVISAKEILKKEYEETPCIVEGLIPVGLVALAAPPKTGKSWFALNLCEAVSEGKPFLGKPCKRGKVLYLALEDNENRLSKRMNLCGFNPENGACLFINDEFSKKVESLGHGFEEQLDELYQAIKPDLIIIDTIQTVKGFGVKGLNAYEADSKLFHPLQQYALNHGICILCITHFRKEAGRSTDDIFDRITGSNGLFGASDAALAIAGKRGTPEKTLHIVSREFEADDLKIILNASTLHWECTGRATDGYQNDDVLRTIHATNPIVKTIIKKLEDCQQWEASATEILEAMHDCGFAYSGDAQSIGYELTGRGGKTPLSDIMRIYDHIGMAIPPRTRAGKIYRFFRNRVGEDDMIND